jgi:hypothetical protein
MSIETTTDERAAQVAVEKAKRAERVLREAVAEALEARGWKQLHLTPGWEGYEWESPEGALVRLEGDWAAWVAGEEVRTA